MSTNPFVGPKPLSGDHPVFGRQRELRELQYLLTSERIVLLYSPSGAGKSSLISGRNGLCDRLKKSFDVWPVTRLSTDPPFDVKNRWVWSAIDGFENGEATEASAGWTLEDYAAARPRKSRPPLLIFDQFEEILRLDPAGAEAKYGFFDQVGTLLRDSDLWALFVMREDFLAQCDPYVRMLPTHMQNHYRLSLLDTVNARAAIQKTAETGGRTFTEAALDRLVNDLADRSHFVEPVQLQVVCHRLCESVAAGAPAIEEKQIATLGDVTVALRSFYEEKVADIVKKTGVSERRLRDWCEHALIVNETIRGQVVYHKNAADALPETAVLGLESSYLIRKENRHGLNWYELAHDRLIRPIQRANAEWWRKQDPLLRTAKAWEENNGSASYLYTGEQLRDVLAQTDRRDLDPLVERFLKVCELAEGDRRSAERRANRLQRMNVALAILAGVTGPVTLVAMAMAISEGLRGTMIGVGIATCGGLGAWFLLWLFQTRRARAEVLSRFTRKFRLDPSLDPALPLPANAVPPSLKAEEAAPVVPLNDLDPDRLRTLQFSVLWIFLVTGSQDGVFTSSELRALKACLRKAGRTKSGSGRLFRSVLADWNYRIEEFFTDQRAARDGLVAASAVLAAVKEADRLEARAALVQLARAVMRPGIWRSTSLDSASEQLLANLDELLAGKSRTLAVRPGRYYRHSPAARKRLFLINALPMIVAWNSALVLVPEWTIVVVGGAWILRTLGLRVVRSSMALNGAFCEACRAWAVDHIFGCVEPVPLSQLRPKLEQGELEALTSLRQYDLKKPDSLRVNVHICPSCRQFCALSVTKVRLSRNPFRRKPQTIDRLLITPEQCKVLMECFGVGENATPAK